MGDISGKSQRHMKGEQGKVFRDTVMWGQNIATVGWGAAIAHGFQSHWQGLWKKSLPRAVKPTTTTNSKFMNEQILRGRENEQGKKHCVLYLTPPGETAGSHCQEQDIRCFRWLSSVSLCGHECIRSPMLRNFVSSNIVYWVVPSFL